MKENNEKIKNLKIMLAQNNDTSNKTKFLLKQVSTDFLNKFFDNNVKESEKIDNDNNKKQKQTAICSHFRLCMQPSLCHSSFHLLIGSSCLFQQVTFQLIVRLSRMMT